MFLIANTLAGSFFGFLFWVVAARVYTTEQVGLGAPYISAVTLLATLGEYGTGTALIRFAPRMGARQVAFVNSSLTATAILAAIVAVAFGVGTPILGSRSRQPRHLAQRPGHSRGHWRGLHGWPAAGQTFVVFQASQYLFARNVGAAALRLAMLVTAGRLFGAIGLLACVGLGALVTSGVSVFAFLPA